MESTLTLIVLLFAILQIAMIIKFFCMCGDVRVMRNALEQQAETNPDALTGFRRHLLLGDKEAAKKDINEVYAGKFFELADNIMNRDDTSIEHVKTEYGKMLQAVDASLPDTLKDIHTIGDLRKVLKMEKA